MKHSDFRIRETFRTATARWRCTDVGSRTIAAIQLKPDLESDWFKGPPYAVEEVVFAEPDFPGCFPDRENLEIDEKATENKDVATVEAIFGRGSAG